jgi:hypothetical protein
LDITSSNSTFTLNVPDVFGVSQTLQGYATDDAFATPEVEIAQVIKGVDGIMSGAFVPYINTMTITFQADSPSITDTMEVWLTNMVSARTPYFGTGFITIPSISKQYELINGLLTRVTPLPQAKKILQPMVYQIMWDLIQPSPL